MEVSLKPFTNKRTIYLIDVIDEESYYRFKQDLDNIVSSDDSVINDNYKALYLVDPSLADHYKNTVKRPDIQLNISSPGGIVYDGLAFYDTLRSYNEEGTYRIVAHMSGFIASMATIVILGCDERIATKNSTFLVHPVSSMAVGTLEDLKDQVKEVDRLAEVMKKIYVERTKLTKEILEDNDKTKKDWFLSAKDAFKYGIITQIQ